MLEKEPESWSWFLSIAYTLLAMFGGGMGYVMRTLERKEVVNKWRILVEGCAAAFVGVLVMLLCQQLNLSARWTGIAVGVFGWLGANATIQVLERILYARLGVSNAKRNSSDGGQEP